MSIVLFVKPAFLFNILTCCFNFFQEPVKHVWNVSCQYSVAIGNADIVNNWRTKDLNYSLQITLSTFFYRYLDMKR